MNKTAFLENRFLFFFWWMKHTHQQITMKYTTKLDIQPFNGNEIEHQI